MAICAAAPSQRPRPRPRLRRNSSTAPCTPRAARKTRPALSPRQPTQTTTNNHHDDGNEREGDSDFSDVEVEDTQQPEVVSNDANVSEPGRKRALAFLGRRNLQHLVAATPSSLQARLLSSFQGHAARPTGVLERDDERQALVALLAHVKPPVKPRCPRRKTAPPTVPPRSQWVRQLPPARPLAPPVSVSPTPSSTLTETGRPDTALPLARSSSAPAAGCTRRRLMSVGKRRPSVALQHRRQRVPPPPANEAPQLKLSDRQHVVLPDAPPAPARSRAMAMTSEEAVSACGNGYPKPRAAVMTSSAKERRMSCSRRAPPQPHPRMSATASNKPTVRPCPVPRRRSSDPPTPAPRMTRPQPVLLKPDVHEQPQLQAASLPVKRKWLNKLKRMASAASLKSDMAKPTSRQGDGSQ
eukprot:m.40501 g.40501  ORF g.40501 m.40501 type:complete len:412 (-) comp11373_c0_seq1:126-1361(-)